MRTSPGTSTEHYEERVERLTPYLPAISAAVLILLGAGFVVGLF